MDEPPLFSKDIDELLPPPQTPAKQPIAPSHAPLPRKTEPQQEQGTAARKSDLRDAKWWHFALFGGLAALAIMLVRAIRSVIRAGGSPIDGREFVLVALASFGVGVAFGTLLWVWERVKAVFRRTKGSAG